MAEIQNESEELKIENNVEEEQPRNETEEIEEKEEEEEEQQQQQTSVTGELVQTEIVKLTVVKEII
jgi:hypothetical protein